MTALAFSESNGSSPDLLAIESIRRHFEARLAAAELVMLPFPHLLLTEVLPDPVFKQILQENPFLEGTGKAFGDAPWAKRLRFENKYDKRFQYDISPSRCELAGGIGVQLGQAFADLNWLGPVLQNRFPEYFSLRFGDISRIPDFWSRLRNEAFLQRLDPGYRLDAHTDVPGRVATCIFSFASVDGYERCGTQLLIPKNPLWRCWGNLHHPLDGFEVAKVSPYKPNAALVFFKTRHAWHSVGTEAALAPDGRFNMQVQISESGDGALIDLSEPELMRNRQFRPEGPLERAYRWIRRGSRAGRGK
jgi:hypothetical protein